MAEEISSLFLRVEAKVDQAVKQLETLNGKIDEIAKSSKKTEKATKSSFDILQESTLGLTAVAIKLDSTWSAVGNQALRLENANERLANAQDRVKDSQKNVNRATEDYQTALRKYGTNSEEARKAAQRLEDAQDEVTRSQRGLTISQNNLTRTQGASIGVVLNVASTTLVMAANVSKAKEEFVKITAAVRAFNIATLASPIGLTLLAGTLLAGKVLYDSYSASAVEAATLSSEAFQSVSPVVQELNNQIAATNAEIDRMRSQADDMLALFNSRNAVLPEEFNIQEQIAQLQEERGRLAESLKKGLLTQEDMESNQGIRQRMIQIGNEIDTLNLRFDQAVQNRINALAVETVRAEEEKTKQKLADLGLTNTISENSVVISEVYSKKIQEIENATVALDKENLQLERQIRLVEALQMARQNKGNFSAERTIQDIRGSTSLIPTAAPPKSNLNYSPAGYSSMGGTTIVSVKVQGSVVTERELTQSISRQINQSLLTRTNGI